MGLSGIGVTELLVILAILVMLFGTKRLRNLGSDVGGALKSFRQATRESEDPAGEHNEKLSDATVTQDARADTEKTKPHG